MEAELAKGQCVPCRGGVPPLKGAALDSFARQLGDGWKVVREHHLEKEYGLDDFRQALEFARKIGEISEQQNHHPDICLSYGKVRVTLFTHKVDGLTESDFVLAAKFDKAR